MNTHSLREALEQIRPALDADKRNLSVADLEAVRVLAWWGANLLALADLAERNPVWRGALEGAVMQVHKEG